MYAIFCTINNIILCCTLYLYVLLIYHIYLIKCCSIYLTSNFLVWCLNEGGVYWKAAFINPRCACTARVTVVVPYVCMYVCMYVCVCFRSNLPPHTLKSQKRYQRIHCNTGTILMAQIYGSRILIASPTSTYMQYK